MFFRDMAMGLLHRGHEVSVLYTKNYSTRSIMRKPSCLLQDRLSITNENGLMVYRRSYYIIPKLSIVSPLLYAMSCVRVFLKYIEKQGMPDIIHAHSSVWAGYAAARLKKRFGVPYVLTEHRGRFTLMSAEARHLVKKWYPLYLKSAFHQADGVILVGSLLMNGLEKYRKEQVKWEIVSNGVDTAFFTPSERKNNSVFTFLAVGGLTYNKGIDLLLNAYAKIKNKYEDIRLVIAGDGPERAKLEKFCTENRLSNLVEFKGWMNRNGIKNLLSEAHVFVLPTRHEAQGVVYLEAMSCGLPIIGTEATPPEICPSFVGVRVQVNDINALSDAMEYVYKNYDTFNKIQIREFAVAEHDRKVVTDKIIALYSRILA